MENKMYIIQICSSTKVRKYRMAFSKEEAIEINKNLFNEYKEDLVNGGSITTFQVDFEKFRFHVEEGYHLPSLISTEGEPVCLL